MKSENCKQTWNTLNPLSRNDFFPIMVWAQTPDLVSQYHEIGVNTYFAVRGGPTEEDIKKFGQLGMYMITHQSEETLRFKDSPVIMAWMHGDEPDNHRKNAETDEWDGGPVSLQDLLDDYAGIKKNDPHRPVVVNFGQGTANDEFGGRAIKAEQYRDYARCADIVSFDVYPVSNIKVPGGWRDGRDLLWYVAKGVDRLKESTDSKKSVWNVLECTHKQRPPYKPTPHQIRAEVWMSIIHGSTGICWFAHENAPTPEKDPCLLLHEEEARICAAEIARQITALAPVLNSATDTSTVRVVSSASDVPIDSMVKQYDGCLYIFSAGMRSKSATGSFSIKGIDNAEAEVLGEDRSVRITDGRFSDAFSPFDVHLYKIRL